MSFKRLDYLFSDEAQQLVAEAYLLPGCSDVKCEGGTNLEDITQIECDWDKMMDIASDSAANINEICGKTPLCDSCADRFRQICGACLGSDRSVPDDVAAPELRHRAAKLQFGQLQGQPVQRDEGERFHRHGNGGAVRAVHDNVAAYPQPVYRQAERALTWI